MKKYFKRSIWSLMLGMKIRRALVLLLRVKKKMRVKEKMRERDDLQKWREALTVSHAKLE